MLQVPVPFENIILFFLVFELESVGADSMLPFRSNRCSFKWFLDELFDPKSHIQEELKRRNQH